VNILIGLLIPFVGTTLGSATVFLLKKELNKKIEKFLLGFASGVMIAASIWSLIIPSIDMASSLYKIYWLPASVGFLLGIFFLILLDYFIKKNESKKRNNLTLAVTLHNIPEGMAVGVIFAGILSGSVTLASAFALSIGIAIQNFPEGAIISMPLKSKGKTKFKSFMIGSLSGIVEPIAAILTILLTKFITPLLPYFLSFAAGAMIYVVVEELIPEAQDNKSNLCIVGLSLGFVLMMVLDVVLG